MNNFVAYHSIKLWGEYNATNRLHFYSGKSANFLRTSIGGKIWVIVGKPNKNQTSFHLTGVYSPEKIRARKHRGFDILGSGKPFGPPIDITNLPWFERLAKEQGNFRFGLNQIQDRVVLRNLHELVKKPSKLAKTTKLSQDPLLTDPELVLLEGAEQIALVRHRKREQSLREAKIAETKKTRNGKLKCEVPSCRFDFEDTYGELGRNYAQVHHLKPLADRTKPSETKLSDLAIVCANCHAMIHRGGKCRPLEALIP